MSWISRLLRRRAKEELPIALVEETMSFLKDVELLLSSNSMKSQIPAPEPVRAPTKFTLRCEWCLEPFERESRSLGEVEKLQQVLFITGPSVAHVPAICDGCYGNVVGSALHYEQLVPGASNSGPSNLMLRSA